MSGRRNLTPATTIGRRKKANSESPANTAISAAAFTSSQMWEESPSELETHLRAPAVGRAAWAAVHPHRGLRRAQRRKVASRVCRRRYGAQAGRSGSNHWLPSGRHHQALQRRRYRLAQRGGHALDAGDLARSCPASAPRSATSCIVAAWSRSRNSVATASRHWALPPSTRTARADPRAISPFRSVLISIS